MAQETETLIRTGRNEYINFIDAMSNSYPANAPMEEIDLSGLPKFHTSTYNDNNCCVYAIVDFDKAQLIKKVLGLNMLVAEKLLLIILLFLNATFYIGSTQSAIPRLKTHLTCTKNGKLVTKQKGYKFYFNSPLLRNLTFISANLLEQDMIGIGRVFGLTNNVLYGSSKPNMSLFVIALMAIDLIDGHNLDRPYVKLTEATEEMK